METLYGGCYSCKKPNDIPELNEYQCGTYKMHSLQEAKEIAQNILNLGISYIDNEAIKLDFNKIKWLSK